MSGIQITEYAPVLIPTLCRYEHLKRCIDSLRANVYSEKTEIFIGLDYPPNEKYVEGYRKVKEYLDSGIDGFAAVHVYEHSSNLGPGGNIDFLRDRIAERFTRFIETEDDNEFAPNFLEYINTCLTVYRDDSNIVAVAGYNYPIDTSDFAGNIYYDDCYFAAFGFGTWVDKFERMREAITTDEFWRMYKSSGLMNRFARLYPNQYCNMVKAALGYGMKVIREDGIWKMDMTYGLYMFAHNKKMVYPTVSKVRNWGYDGSGENCENMSFDSKSRITHRNFDSRLQKLDDGKKQDKPVVSDNISYEETAKRLNEYFEVPVVELLKTKLAYMGSLIVGVERIGRLIGNKNE